MILWAQSLLLLVFISKLSFDFLGVPSEVPFLVFQHGLHPFWNIILNFILGLPLVFYALSHPYKLEKLTRTYRALLFIVFVVLSLETLLQFVFMENMKGPYAWAALSSTHWLIFIFGMVLPVLSEPAVTLRFLSKSALVFVVISLILWLLRPDITFKGGRFVGVFKHIPYMVTCASIGVIFTLGQLQSAKNNWYRWGYGAGIGLSFFALLLTGTRSALAAVVMAVVLWILRSPIVSTGFRYFKYSSALVFSVVVVLFGNQIMDYAKDVATGKKSLVEREAQDGVASRLEEVERGWAYFQTSPWLGLGLLAKFAGKERLEVNSYNSFKDPHNIIVSAGVVGGWPFIVWTLLFLFLLLGISFKALISEDTVVQIFGIYAVVQFPILIIYHWHLSLGGMADRFYWLVFGYLALNARGSSPVQGPSVQ